LIKTKQDFVILKHVCSVRKAYLHP